MNDPRWSLAQRIVGSPHLSTSPKLCEFFLYVVDCCLRDAPEEATEQQIGVHVFHRIPGYNSSDDSIVRSQARLLRMKLSAYFSNEGSSEELVVEIPKGHYLPVFRPANHSLQSMAAPVSDLPVEISSDPESSPRPVAIEEPHPSTRKLSWKSIAAALLFLLAGSLIGLLIGRQLPSTARTGIEPFWNPFFTGDPPLVIYSNPLFKGTPYTGLRLVPGTGSTDPSEIAGVPDETYTGTGEVTAIYELTRIFEAHHANFTLKRSRLVTWDEAKLRNLIFVGAPSQNGALQDLPSTPDFAINLDGSNKGFILNRHPQPGEPQSFIPSSPNDEYAIVASIPGIQPNLRTAVFTGLTTNGTQAAVEFACDPENVRQLSDRLGQTGGALKPFEAVLHIKLSGGVPLRAELAAVHAH